MKNLLKLILPFCLIPFGSVANDYSQQLAGKRLVLQSASCAGYEFKADKDLVLWRNEIECTRFDDDESYADKWRIKWLSDKIFVLIELEQYEENRAPSIYIYEVLSMKGGVVRLLSFWTGKDYHDDTVHVYRIKK